MPAPQKAEAHRVYTNSRHSLRGPSRPCASIAHTRHRPGCAPTKLNVAVGSVTRMLADAGLIAQQATGVATEPLVVQDGRGGIVSAAAGAGLLVIGLSERWRREGLGPIRSEIAKGAPAPVLFVRRGTRPGLFAPRDSVTQFKWSMAETPVLSGG